MDLLHTLPLDLSRFVSPFETLSRNPLNLVPTRLLTAMNIITKYAPSRLAVYGFYNDSGGLPAALELFTALLAANYHPSLTSTTCVNGIYSLTLVELPFNELDTFRTQQLADEQSWGKPLSYFDFAKLNPRVTVEITADDYAYMLSVLPPIHGRHCFAMGDLYTHNAQGQPIYYWACKRDARYFGLLGTQQEAEQEFAPTLISDAHTTLIQELIVREDIAGRPSRALERLLNICQTTTVVLPSITASPKQLGQLCPSIIWTKPLTACGPDHDPNMKLHGTVDIDGVSFHAEAFEVAYSTDGEQIGKQDEEETHLAEICNIVQGAADTIAIAGREYVLAIIPGQR